jgi:hypothetical protein
MQQPLPTLDAVAAGKWAHYEPQDNKSATRLASGFNPFRIASND